MRRYFFMLVASLALLGCGGPQYQPPDLSGYVWPPPPHPPKIKLIKVVRTDADVRFKTTSEALFGEQAWLAFKKPHGIATDNAGNVYVSDTYLRKVFVLDFEKGKVGEIENPYGWSAPGFVATDNVSGLIGVVDGRQVYLFEQASKKFKLAVGQAGEMGRPVGIAFDPQRKILYVSDADRHEVHSFDYEGRYRSLLAARGSEPGEVYFPLSLATDSEGRLYVVDSMNWRVQIFNPNGSIYGSFGQHGDQPGAFARPKGITVSEDGLVFITDAAFDNFQVFDKEGRGYTFVGAPGTGFGRFHQPQGIYIDNTDRVYVVDQTNRRIQIFQYLSERYLKAHPEEAK